MSPASVAPNGPTPTRRARTYAPIPQRTQDNSATTFIARTGLPVTHSTGAAKKALPIRFSE